MAAEALNVKAEEEEEEDDEEEQELLGPAFEIKEQCGDENLFSLRPKS